MAFHKSVEETMSELVCHMIKRTDRLNTGAQLANGQESIGVRISSYPHIAISLRSHGTKGD